VRIASTTGVFETNLNIRRRKLVCSLLGPFHEAHGVAAKDVPEAGV
jgi:hypothetical protein